MTWEWGTPLLADFATMGLVRRFVEMFLKAGISPRVGRNDGAVVFSVPCPHFKKLTKALPY